MAGLTYLKDGGVWKLAPAMWVKDAGVWRQVDQAWLKHEGVWKEIFTAAFEFNDTISSYVENPDPRNRAMAAGWDGVIPLIYTLTVTGTGLIGSSSTGLYAFDTGPASNFPSGVELRVNVQPGGQILGRNGPGGGGLGGPAFRAQVPTTLDNQGVIGGAGNGGANGSGGSYYYQTCDASGNCQCVQSCTTYGGSGGRGAGCLGGAQSGTSGSMGTCLNNGCGATYTNGQSGRPLGDAYCVVGNANITWVNFGTRYGPIA